MRNLKKILALVLALVMSLSLVTIASAYKDDADVSGTYEEAVTVLTELGVFEGEGGSFYPQRSITRAETAAILYRIVTGDVDDVKDHLYSDYMKFTDTYASMWYAGYIGFCSNAELIKGYGGGLFGPQDNVTGYQALAMILRAIGYGQNGEFQGTGWEIRVASTAEEIGLLKNITESTLGKAATREMVAEMLYQGILVKKVTYSAISKSYVTLSNAKSIAQDTFKLSDPFDGLNEWGQPSKKWTFEDQYEKSQTIDIPYEAVASYTTAVKECDVADDFGFSGSKTFTTYTNGKVNKDTDTLSATATTATIGAQGRQTYVYDTKDADIIVYIDTFLAQVTKVTEVKTDANGHIAKQASLTLAIYAAFNNPTEVILYSDSNYSYSVGEMLLVNAVTDSNALHSTIATDGDKYVKILGDAESFVGAQTYIQWSDNQHTVGGKVYDDALHFHWNQAGLNRDINFNWWLDQFGNLIGVTAIDRTNYAVLKDMKWVVGTPGYAQATLVYMDGSEATVTVNAIDGDGEDAVENNFWDFDNNNNATPWLNDAVVGFVDRTNRANVSEDTRFNDYYDGFALYQVITLDDGTVDLQAFHGDPDSTGRLLIDYANDARLDIDGSEIRVNGSVVADVDSSTKFIVNNGDGTYSAYVGTANLPDFANGSVEVFWSVDDGFTQNVYIKSFVEQAAFGDHLFTTNKTVGHEVGNWEGVNYWTMNVVVDGVERTIVTNRWVRDILVNNTGKLFHVTWDRIPTDWPLVPNYTYGYVTSVRLVNETTDGDVNGSCDYLTGTITVGTNAIKSSTSQSYNLSYATQVVYNGNIAYTIDNLDDAIAAGMGIWVVDETRDGINNKAFTIYVGTKLSTDDSITVAGAEGDNNVYDIDGYDVTIDERFEDAHLVISANNDHAVYNVTVNEGTTERYFGFQDTDVTVKLGDTIKVNVWNETFKVDDTPDATYTIYVNNYYQIGDAITTVKSSGGRVTLGGAADPLPMYHSFDVAIAKSVTLTRSDVEMIRIHANNNLVVADINADGMTSYGQYVAQSHRFTNSADVEKATFDASAENLYFTAGASAEIGSIRTWNTSDYYVISMCVRPDGANSSSTDVVYFAFQVQ